MNSTLEKYADYFRRLCKLIFFLVFDQISLLGRRCATDPKRKLLLIKVDALGDFVLWLASVKGYRQLFPADEYETTLIGNQSWTDLAESLPFFDRVIPLNRLSFETSPIYRWRFLLAVRREGFEVVISPTFSREFLYGDSLVRVSGADRRIGSQGDCSNIHSLTRWVSNRWYTLLAPASSKPMMELLRNIEFLRELGIKAAGAEFPCLPAAGASTFKLPIGEYYVICPGAGSAARRWPWQSFLALSRRIYQTSGLTGVLCGSWPETSLAARICQEADFPVINLVGTTSLVEMTALLANARFLVSNETGTVHLAAAVKTPSVCILGGGHHGRFLPYPQGLVAGGRSPVVVARQMDCFGCNWYCSQRSDDFAPAPCVAAITVDDVWLAVRSLLKN